MRYALLLHHPEMTEEMIGAAALEEGQRAMASYAGALEQAGVLISAQVLQHSPTATTIRVDDEDLRIQDGPFADTKAQLGGVVIIDVPDLDTAIGWARQAPSARWGAVEIRPGAVHTEAGVWQPSA